jgi:hypothetical protein
VSVVRRDTYRRWAVVGVAIAVLCSMPSVIGALPVNAAAVTPADLKARILASADHPYQGYAQSVGGLNLPQLPQLTAVGDLLSGATTVRTWFSSPDLWRTDVITATGEQDLYQTDFGTIAWNFETGQVTEVAGEPKVRLPRADDLLPPKLGLRLLHTAATTDPVYSLPARDVAGIAADGLEIRPASPDTTIARVDIWADPATGVPLEVSVYAKGAKNPVITSRFLDVSLSKPADDVVQFVPNNLPITQVQASDINALLDRRPSIPLPGKLADLPSAPALEGYSSTVSGYGTGFSTFAVLFLGDRIGDSAFSAAKQAGAAPVTMANGTGELIRTPLLSVLLVRASQFGRVFLLVGFTSPDLLVRAGTELLSDEEIIIPFRCQPPCQGIPVPGGSAQLILPGGVTGTVIIPALPGGDS